MTLESFHSVGRFPEFSDLLNKYVSDGAILEAHSFNKRVGMLSGAKALLGFRLLSALRTSHCSRMISVMDSLEAGGTGW